MQDFKEQPRSISLFPSTCETGNGHFSPDISPAEASYVTISCDNPHDYNIVTCQSPNRQEFVNEVSGLQLDLALSSLEIEQLPFYIPSLDLKAASRIAPSVQYPYIGITLKDIVGSLTRWVSGGLREAQQIRFRPIGEFEAFSNNPKLLLFLTGTDTAIEYLWRERYNCNLFGFLKNMNFAAVSGFNFSLFDGECAFSQALNQKRSLYSSYLFDQYGIKTIPHIYALTPYQIKRYMQWLISNPNVRYFTINCQMEKTGEYINKNVKIIRYILENLPYLHIILQGFPFDAIHKFGPVIDNIHFVDAVPQNHARNHIQIDVTNTFTKSRTRVQAAFFPLLLHNINARKTQLENARRKIFELHLRKTG